MANDDRPDIEQAMRTHREAQAKVRTMSDAARDPSRYADLSPEAQARKKLADAELARRTTLDDRMALLDVARAFEADTRTQQASVLSEEDFEPHEADEDFIDADLELQDRGERNKAKRSRLVAAKVRGARHHQHQKDLHSAMRRAAGTLSEAEDGTIGFAQLTHESIAVEGGKRANAATGKAWRAIWKATPAVRAQLIEEMGKHDPGAARALDREIEARSPKAQRSGQAGGSGQVVTRQAQRPTPTLSAQERVAAAKCLELFRDLADSPELTFGEARRLMQRDEVRAAVDDLFGARAAGLLRQSHRPAEALIRGDFGDWPTLVRSQKVSASELEAVGRLCIRNAAAKIAKRGR
ncbi:MAG: hypothetical protein CMN30_15820 [Sandaracinus sp.]|nr:hypothetical protein [Sandaracinus sp.]|tara:strand:+ start:1864 stop:2922 length:1059 start_codon:yes stop_codon:yes gene_type:complete